ncbi:MAG TPA: methyltransferase domain-containing protein [Candidatus Woesebacteria bacterium]|nr:methyltransferase domain-containing protein [Candidatus Woesebacteria bacterium]
MKAELVDTLPHFYHQQPDIQINTSHLIALHDEVMYRLIHTYNAIDPILESLQPEQGLNIAAYTFFAEEWLRKHIKHLHSFDLLFDMVDNHGRNTIESFEENNVSISTMNVMNLAFEDNTFDVATYIELAGTSKSTDYDFVIKSLEEVHRVLKPGGSLFINFKNVSGEQKLKEHPQYNQIASEIKEGFPNFRGVPISRDKFLTATDSTFEEVETLGHGFITPQKLPFVYTVENESIQWDPKAIRAKTYKSIDFEHEYPLYWTIHLAKR